MAYLLFPANNISATDFTCCDTVEDIRKYIDRISLAVEEFDIPQFLLDTRCVEIFSSNDEITIIDNPSSGNVIDSNGISFITPHPLSDFVQVESSWNLVGVPRK